MGNKLFVGNLPWSIQENALNELFSEVGAVESVNIITDRNTGRSKGFGFVEMESDDAASKAIEQFDQKELDGRKITVNIAKPRENRPR